MAKKAFPVRDQKGKPADYQQDHSYRALFTAQAKSNTWKQQCPHSPQEISGDNDPWESPRFLNTVFIKYTLYTCLQKQKQRKVCIFNQNGEGRDVCLSAAEHIIGLLSSFTAKEFALQNHSRMSSFIKK